jgi:hypothetical protein
LQKYQQQPTTLLFSPFYSPTHSSNHLIALDILTLVSWFLQLVMLLHFDLSTLFTVLSSLVKWLCLLHIDLLNKKFPFPNNKHKVGMDMISF